MKYILTLIAIIGALSGSAQRGIRYDVYYVEKTTGDASYVSTIIYGRILSNAEEKKLKAHFIYTNGRDFRKKYKTCIHKTILL